jgi:hypothetical protein
MNTMKFPQFQGISKEGDFQSALLEANKKALEALSIGTSDQRIEWKIIKISGSKGGLLGENTITVTIEGPTTLARSHHYLLIQPDLKAIATSRFI